MKDTLRSLGSSCPFAAGTRSRLLALAALLMLQSAHANPVLPVPGWNQTMRPGIGAMTCTSSGLQTPAGLAEHVLVLLDLRDPMGCGATPILNNASAWNMPSGRMFFDPSWSVNNLGEVFGVDVGTGPTSNIYISALGPKPCDWGNSYWANRSYGTANANTGFGGEVWCINGTNYTRQLVACLPNHRGFFSGSVTGGANCSINGNSFVGLGNLSYSQRFQKLYVTNLDDGKIYVVDVSSTNCGNVVCTFDHGAQPGIGLSDDPTQLYTQRHRMVFGIEYHPQANRLFYALRNALNQDEIWSLGLDANGCPVGNACLEVTNGPFAPLTNGAPSNFPSDIQFSPDGTRMLVIHQSITFFPVTVTGITSNTAPPIGGYAPSQIIAMRYAHSSLPWEFTRPNAAQACGGWAVQGSYTSGIVYANQNAVAGDYGYGDMFATPALDSVITVAECIRPVSAFPLSYAFGLQIHPVGDYGRSTTLQNFDAPLLAPSGAASTKIQLNDIDVLHEPPCMAITIVPGSVQCPVVPGGNGTLQITVTNSLPYPVFGLNLTNCSPLPLPPGAVGITPQPVALPGGILNPGATTPPLTVTLPNLPVGGGLICFCVQLIDETPQGVQCQQMVCVPFNCAPPCMSVVPKDIVCDPVAGYSMTLCVTNLQPAPMTTVSFSPCAPVPPGAMTAVPALSPVTLGSPLPNGGTACIPVNFPSLPPSGGLLCFNVTLSGAAGAGGSAPVCTSKVCVTLPACHPPCADIIASDIECPPVSGGSYTLNLSVQNLTAFPVTMLNIGNCPPGSLPPGAVPALPSPSGYIPLNPPLAPGATAVIPLALPGLPCTGVKACFCVALLGDPNGGGGAGGGDPEEPPLVLCQEMVCIDLPACDCPPCMSTSTGNLRCPTVAGNPYLLDLQITNLHPSTAYYYGLASCPAAPGFTPIQPTPGGVQPLPTPLPTNATSVPLTIGLPAPLTGGGYCFCVVLLGQDGQTILCQQQVCVTLPKCRCADVTVAEVICLPDGTTQLVLNVTNFTQLYGAPYNFELATFSPSSGFSPASAVPVPNPILPGASGTVTVSYVGPVGPKCVTVVLSNAARTKCCPVQVCFDNPECVALAPVGTCALREVYFCENGSATVTFYITNVTATPQAYQWSIAPASVPGCTSTLPPGAFTPGGGTTPTLAPFSTAGISVAVSAGAIAPGTCAGFQVCFLPVSQAAGAPICCTSKVKCPGLADPCIMIGDPIGRILPGGVIGIPIDIKNPTGTPIDRSLVISDDSGALTFYRDWLPSGDATRGTSSRDPNLPPDPYAAESATEISEDAPLFVSVPAHTTQSIVVYAQFTGSYRIIKPVGNIVIGPPCVRLPVDDNSGTGRVFFGPSAGSDGGATPPPHADALSVTGRASVAGRPALAATLRPVPGLAYFFEGSADLHFADPLAAYVVPPSLPGAILEADGRFFPDGATTELRLLALPGVTREFYRLHAAIGTESPGLPVSDGR